MNDHDRSEFEDLRLKHRRLEQELAILREQFSALERRVERVPFQQSAPQPVNATVESLLSRMPCRGTPPPVPPVIPKGTAERLEIPKPPETRNSPPVSAGDGSFELRLGTFWLVRVGVVMVLTALVFFGNLAYQHYISQLGPAGKVALLYVASFLLLGGGAWWQRNSARESLRNYAQVLFAGGLAAVYFTTYAAHHFPMLRVIHSALLDGILLLGWTAFMVWVADRKKSEVMALFAVGLAFYASVITRVGFFTLYSNLLLSAAVVYFLVRNRWATLSFGTLIASYVAYAFWRFLGPDGWRWATAGEGLWTGAYFLFAYWVLFTACVFLSRYNEKFAFEQRSLFLSFNNAALLSLFILTMLQVREGGVWRFLLLYGTVLLGLAELARRTLTGDPLAKTMYLTQGLLLVTLGFIFKFTGMQLALLLAAESLVLLVLGQQGSSIVLRTGAYVTAALGVAWGLHGLWPIREHGVYAGLALTLLMVVNAVFCSRQATVNQGPWLRPQVAYFAVLALAALLTVTCVHASRQWLPVLLGVEAVLLFLSFSVLRVREIAVLGQAFVIFAHFAALLYYDAEATHWWRPSLLLGITFGLGLFWGQRNPGIEFETGAPLNVPLVAQRAYWWVGAIGTLYWVYAYISPPDTIWAYSLLGLMLFAAAGIKREREFLPLSGLFTSAALFLTWIELIQFHPVRWMLLIAVLLLLLQQRLTVTQSARYEVPERVQAFALIVGGLSLWWILSRWVMESASGFYLTASWSLFALALFSLGILGRERLYRWLGLGILACAMGRVVVFDVWKLDTGFRVLSFLALGIVMMLLGYIYNRYQEKIRQWL